MIDFDELVNSVVTGDNFRALELTRQTLDAGIEAKEVLEKGLARALDIVGRQFAKSEIFLPELILAGDAVKEVLKLLKPELTKRERSYLGKYVIGTVRGDVHDLGKDVVIMMLEGNGWEVTDLGIDVSPEQFCKAVKKGDFDILGLGAYVSITMPEIETVIKALKDAGLRDKVKVMIGGVPVTQAYADRVGADAYGETAVDAVIKAKQLIKG